MTKLKLNLNNRVDILEDKKIYKCTIQDVTDGKVFISVPATDGEYMTLTTGKELELVIYDDNGNVFSCRSKVEGRKVEDNISMYMLSELYDIKKIQRRNYVRVEVLQVIGFKRKNEEAKFSHALLLDLSGGGMRIKVDEKLEPNELVKCVLKYNDDRINVEGKVVRVYKTEDKKYIYGINFDDIENNTRERIIKIVFTIMRKQREVV